ncbi:MAG: DUF58 domain-containing protein, partial [Bacteroidota bacterium]|nr:DUF58 domain-containing protein [Bacteroidota bacterium]
MIQAATGGIDLERLQQFGSLELLARQVVEGFMVGLHKSPFHGFSVEFAEHRLYNPGDTTRHIDWKLFGRTERLYTKKYEEETNLRCQLVIDNSSSMYFPEGAINKLQFSVYAAASIVYMLRKQRDAVGLTMFSDKIEKHLNARSSPVHGKLLYTELENLLHANKHNKTSAAAATLHTVAESIHKRSLVAIFSDMLDNSEREEELFSALQHLKYKGHEVMLFHTMDEQKEVAFQYENRPSLFID